MTAHGKPAEPTIAGPTGSGAAGSGSSFRPARQVRLYQDVGDQLREEILSFPILPGDRLPPERELMASFGVSRAVIRQATVSLEHEGLVDVQVGAGGARS